MPAYACLIRGTDQAADRTASKVHAEVPDLQNQLQVKPVATAAGSDDLEVAAADLVFRRRRTRPGGGRFPQRRRAVWQPGLPHTGCPSSDNGPFP
jgi:hypothetical protein